MEIVSFFEKNESSAQQQKGVLNSLQGIILCFDLIGKRYSILKIRSFSVFQWSLQPCKPRPFQKAPESARNHW